ncbi:MAG TPA: hypothetical protein DCX14_14685 [Flavobacteriales bacterium]|nr:hypothetical protein [Flavobacteriales bacterium]
MKAKLLLFSTFLAAFFGLQQNASAQYCTPAYTVACGTYNMTVNSFSTTGGSVNITNNNQGCSNSTGYTYYSSLGHTALTNSTVNFSVGTGTTYATHVYIWVDWNQDDDFYDSGEQVAFALSQAANSTWSGSFDIPATATPGTTRMRIRTLYYGSSGMHPCNTLPYGEAEDYNLTILPPFNNDAGIGAILNPVVPTCDLDSVDIDVSVQNLGSDTLQNCSIYYQVNTSTPVAMYYTGSVAPQGGLDTLTIANVSFTNGDDLTVWTELPNGVQDSLNANDEKSMVTATGLSGTFGIPGDYATINDAATDLESFGVCGDVIFNIAAGTYNEQVEFNEIIGTSEDATVTFQSASGNASDVVITYAGTSSANGYVIKFDGADYITFSDVKMTNTGSYYGNVAVIAGQSDHITLDGNWLKGNTGTSTNYQSVINMPGTGSDVSLTNNRIEKGSCWFYSNSGSTAAKKMNLTIEDNKMKDQTYYGGYIWYFDGVEFNRNTITNDSSFQYGYGYYGMGYWYYCDNFNITNNYVGATTGNGWYYAMYMYQCVGSSNPRSLIANNCMTTGNTTSPTAYYALYMSQSGLVDIYNNSFTRSANNNSYAGYIYQGGAINLKNNSFANMGSGYALYMNGGFTINESDNNNYYNTGGSITYWGNSVYQTVEAMSMASGQDENSVSTDPNWQDLFTCVTCNDTLSDAGTPLSTVASDIAGNTRSTQSPDIGAMEFVNANSFSLGGDDTLCGNELLIEAGPAQSVAWGVSENGGSTQTYTTSSITLSPASSEPSNFSVNVVLSTEFCGNATDDVVIRLVPDATLDSSAHICADETATLTPGGGSAATYAWSNGATTATVDADAPGMYTVTKMEDGCESSATISISQSVAVQLADVEGCEDDAPLTVDATIPDGSSYAWSGGSAQTAAANEFSASGAYTVTATDIHGCVSTAAFDLLVLGEPEAAIDYVGTGGTAIIFSSASSTNTSPNTTYLWTFNSIDTSTAANPTYVFPFSGVPVTYPVTLVVDNGCGESLKSKDINIDPIGVDELEVKAFEVYPNPATDNFFIAAGSDFNTLDVTIIDNAGRSVYTQSYNGQQVIEVNASELASGAYLIKMLSETSSEVQTLIVQ